MSPTERILLLLDVASAGGLTPAIIGDIVGLASHELEPILFRLVEHGHVVYFCEGREQRRYCIAESSAQMKMPPPRWSPSVPRWMVR
jgi:hypothetical protein